MDADLMARLRDPRVFLPTFASVIDQSTGGIIRYHPDKVSPQLQHSVMAFVADPPKTRDGHNLWLAVVAPRQITKSVTVALSLYARTAYTPGSYTATISDTRARTEDLFRAVTISHEHVHPSVRMETIPNRESRQLTFEHGAKYRTLTAGTNMVGIGRAVDNLQISEVPFIDDMAGLWFGLRPALTNRKEAVVILESTPAPMSEPGSEFYRDLTAEARRGGGRFLYLFVPFFQSRLNERTWDDKWSVTNEELRLLDHFGPRGPEEDPHASGAPYLTFQNLAFRRRTLEEDPLIRRNPELFWVFYPIDDVSCWAEAGGGAIPRHALERHLARVAEMAPWDPPDNILQVYEPPNPASVYVLAVDPAGWTGGDQASFQVLGVTVEEKRQVACASSNLVDPTVFARIIIETAHLYNDALVVVENNGVGLGTLAILELAATVGVTLPDANGVEQTYRLKNLHYGGFGKPGVASSSKTLGEGMARLVDDLLDSLVLNDRETLAQLQSYRRDKDVEDSDKAKILRPDSVGRGRRKKHHWDRVSALLWACWAAPLLPRRYSPRTAPQVDHLLLDKPFDAFTGEEQKTYRELLAKDAAKRKKRRRVG